MTKWSEQRFKATHNSWQGNNQGSRGDIWSQLDEGVRYIELDITDEDFQKNGGYSMIPDDGRGKGIWLKGNNPKTLRFTDWLGVIARWSLDNPAHSPIVILVDFKGPLDGQSFAQGNLAALNQVLMGVFADKLVLAETLGAGLPEVETLKGKIVTVLTDNARVPYLSDGGQRPGVSINSLGQVVEVHDSGHGTLWYWTGQMQTDGSVRWARHGYYDTGEDPSVALRDDGVLVEVHKSQNNDGLYYHVGRLGADLEITWSKSHKFDSGVNAVVRWSSVGGGVEEMHQAGNSSQLWSSTGTVDATAQTVTWTHAQKVLIPQTPWDKTRASAGDHVIHVASESNNGSPSSMLYYYSGKTVGPLPIRYRQVSFVDIGSSDPYWMSIGQWFASMPQQSNPDYTFLEYRHDAGWLTRIFDFDNFSPSKLPWQAPTFPATDDYNTDYTSYCANIGTTT